MHDSQLKFVEKTPESARGIVERAFKGTSSPRAAIKAHCLVCTNFDRQAVRDCPVILCPLIAYRPFQVKEVVESESDDLV